MEMQDDEHQDPHQSQADQPQAIDANTLRMEDLSNEVEARSAISSLEWVGRGAQAALQDLNASSDASKKGRDEALKKAKDSSTTHQVSEGSLDRKRLVIASLLFFPIVLSFFSLLPVILRMVGIDPITPISAPKYKLDKQRQKAAAPPTKGDPILRSRVATSPQSAPLRSEPLWGEESSTRGKIPEASLGDPIPRSSVATSPPSASLRSEPLWGEESSTRGKIPEASLRVVNEIVKNLEWGNIAFDTPKKLKYGESKVVKLLLSPNKSRYGLWSLMKNHEQAELARIQVSNRMEADLSGQGFKIEALVPEEQAVYGDKATYWKWEVTPTKDGDQTLHLAISAIINVSDNQVPLVVQTFSKIIKVEISPAQRVSIFVSSNWQWMWASILIPLSPFIWKWHKQKRFKKKLPSSCDSEETFL